MTEEGARIFLRGESQRGQNRVREHGREFLLLKRVPFRGHPAVLVEALDGTGWSGWLQLDREVVEEAR